MRPNSTPCAFGLLCGERSPDRYGRNSGQRARSASATDAAASSSAASSANLKVFAAQLTALAAESITDIWCQRLGSAWQKACIACAGFGRKRSVETNTTPEVPSETKPCPGSTSPMPTALAALSPAPPAIFTPSRSPQRAASSGLSSAETSLPSTSRGMWSRVSPVAASSSSDQSRAPTSSHSVPAASDISLTASPLSMKRSQSLGSSTRATRAKTSGSCSRTHSSLGAVKPGIARLPAISPRRGTARVSASHCAPLRPSFQRMAGRSTSPAASSSVAPCIWPDRPMARTCASAFACVVRSSAMTASSACHHWAGACSDHSGCGRSTVSGARATPTMR
ncbi:hypothetical protein D3C86_744950 [compost metagenome]